MINKDEKIKTNNKYSVLKRYGEDIINSEYLKLTISNRKSDIFT
jgi:hypothetical protein